MLLRVYLIIFLFSGVSLGEDFKSIQVSDLSNKEVITLVEERVKRATDEGKLSLIRNVYQENRADLFLDLMKIRELPTDVVFREADESHFKYQLTLDMLKTDDLWSIPLVTGLSGVGSLYHQSWALCRSVIEPFFQDDKIDWTGNLTKERRHVIAEKFEILLVDKEGFVISKKEKVKRNIEREVENKRDSSRNPSSFQKGDKPEVINSLSSKKLDLPWIVTGILLLGILALLFKKFKNKSAK